MQQPDNNSHQPRYLQEEDTIDIKKLVLRLLSYWYWFVLCIILSLGIAFFYNRYTTRVYEISSSLLIDAGKSVSPLSGGGGEGDLFGGFGLMSSSLRDFYNQVIILKSNPVIEKALEGLDFEVSYYSVGRIMSSESYKSAPFRVKMDRAHPQLVGAEFQLAIHPNGKLTININHENAVLYDYNQKEIIGTIPLVSYSKEVEAGTKIETKEFSFTILLDGNFDPNSPNNHYFRFNTMQNLVSRYKSNLTVETTKKENSILDLTLRDYNVQKGIDFLNKLIEVYQLDNLGQKNEKANRTVRFIDGQLQTISDSLTVSENQMQTFQVKNKVLDLSLQSQQLLEQVNELDKERLTLETKNKYYNYLNRYIQNFEELESIIAPSAMGIDDPLLNSLILQLNQLIFEKSSMGAIRNAEHPKLKRINAQIESTKKSLVESTYSIIAQSELALSDVKARLSKYESMVRRLPATERSYVNIERKYQLNNNTYTFLLQKLAEAQIAKASNVPDSRVIEEAQLKGAGPVEPKTNIIYAIGGLLGLLLPALIIFLADFFNNKIRSKEEIEAMTRYPIIGHVLLNDAENKSPTPVLDKPNSPIGEPYSAITSKLNLITKGKEKAIIAVTSAFPNEGKSYNAINIASSFALKKKKTVLLDLDLRNSRIKQNFKLDSDLGVVNYIIGEASVNDIIFDTKHPFMKIIPAGPIPPNPIEMLNDEKLAGLIDELKERFDVIVLDTTPIGFVADLFQVVNLVDAYMFIVRHNQTNKNGLKTALEEVENQQLKGVGIIVNAIRQKRRYGGYGYGYGYGHGYGYGYGYGYGQDGKQSGRKRLKKV